MADTWLTLREAGDVLRLSRSGLLQRIKARKIEAHKGNDGQWRVLVDPDRPPVSAHDHSRARRLDTLKSALARVEAIEPAYQAQIADLQAALDAAHDELARERRVTRRLLREIALNLRGRVSLWRKMFGLRPDFIDAGASNLDAQRVEDVQGGQTPGKRSAGADGPLRAFYDPH